MALSIDLLLCRLSQYIYYYAQCSYAECRYAECRSAEIASDCKIALFLHDA